MGSRMSSLTHYPSLEHLLRLLARNNNEGKLVYRPREGVAARTIVRSLVVGPLLVHDFNQARGNAVIIAMVK